MKLTQRIRVEGVFPLPLSRLWRLLHVHLDEDRIRGIHPWVLSGQTIREGRRVEFEGLPFPREKVAERTVKVVRRPSKTTWSYVVEPPTRYRYEIKFEDGSITTFDNTYASAEGGTLVTTVGDLSIRRMPSFLANWIVKRSLNRSDGEDLAYARKMNL